jgi:hypothetical protein
VVRDIQLGLVPAAEKQIPSVLVSFEQLRGMKESVKMSTEQSATVH